MTGRRRGFTIIEIMLFMAISGALFVMAAGYMSGTINNVRFQDGVKTTESFVEKQYTEVQTNAVNRPTLPSGKSLQCTLDPLTRTYTVFTLVDGDGGASNTCIVLGVAMHFDGMTSGSGRIDVYPVIGTDHVPVAQVLPSALASTRPTIYDGQGVDPSITPGPARVYELPWQSYWSDPNLGIYVNGTPKHFNTFAILRAPDNETINTYVTEPTYTSGEVSGLRSGLFSAVTTPAQVNQQAIVCLKSDSSGAMRGSIILDGAGNTANNFSISSILSRIAPSSDVIVGGMKCV